MKFKSPHMKSQYESLPWKLQEICEFFEQLANSYGRDAVVTRVTDPVEGESGVHPVGRAVDFRDEFMTEKGPTHLFFPDEAIEIVAKINTRYRRTDGKKVAIHHSFNGGPEHFHLQIPSSWVEEDYPPAAA